MHGILLKIKPSTEEKQWLLQIVKSFLTKLNSKLKDAQAILGGSGAKGTFLAGSYDIDIYVQYNYKKYAEKSAELSNLLEKTLKQAFPKYQLIKLHGSRDYFQINYENYVFEIVPILKINKAEEAKNITDISPLHALWVNKKVKNKDEVLLAKQFCKANGVYGAESHLQGFSGYALEILISVYGTFTNLLKAAQKWKLKEVIDPEKYYKKGLASFHLNQSKQLSPIIIIDPVDKSRNAAAALSEEKLELFKKRAQEYLKNPSDNFFVKKELDMTQLQKEKGHLVFLDITPLTGKKDVVGAKILKIYHFLQNALQPFKIKKSGWEYNGTNNSKMYFILKRQEISPEEIRKGPPLNLKENVLDFKKKNKNTFLKNGKIYARVKVAYPQLESYIQHLLQEEYVKERAKEIKRIKD